MRLILLVVALAACRQKHSLAQTQQNASCSTTVQLIVDGTSSLDAVYSSLDDAKACGGVDKVSISVEWNGAVEINETIVVPNNVRLRVRGEGFLQDADAISLSSNISSGGSGGGSDSTAAMSSVIRGNGNVGLFTVESDGELYISGMALQNGWGGEPGGGGIYADQGSTVLSETCLWQSLSAAQAGGALTAIGAANITLRGTNIFSGCSSEKWSGGAIHLQGTTLSAQGDIGFENCQASSEGGGLYMHSTSRLAVAEGSSISFSNCMAGSESGGYGGGLSSHNSKITVGANANMSFKDNFVLVKGDGGGLFALGTSIDVSSGANISFVDNHAGDGGGGMFLSGTDENVDEEDVITCFTLGEGSNAMFIGNSGGGSSSTASFQSGSIGFGGGVHFSTGCNVLIEGDAYFEQNSAVRAGAMYLDTAKAVVSGSVTFVNNTAERWGGAVAVTDSDSGLELNGRFTARNNLAGRSGGALYVENARLAMNTNGDEDVGALWQGNYAGYDGGAIAVDGGEVHLEGGFACSNTAAQRGGVIFATGDSLLSWTGGESWNNSAVFGGSLFISNSEANLTDVRLVGDHTPSGAVVFFADAEVRAINTSIVAPEELEGDFALHVDKNSVLMAFACSFEKWNGDNHAVLNEGILVLDACDFRQSTGATLFRAQRPATIRNAVLGNGNYASLGNNDSFGFTASTCSTLSEAYSCLDNEQEDDCVDAEYGMGVLCTRYIAAATGAEVSLSGVGSSIEVVTSSTSSSSSSPSSASLTGKEVYFPELVVAELTLRYSGDETTDGINGSWSSLEVTDTVVMGADAVLWELRSSDGTEYGGLPNSNRRFAAVSADNFSWVAMPVSGVLVEGQEITINFVGTPPPPSDPSRPSAMYNGEVSAAFHVLSQTAKAGAAIVSSTASFKATFYYCGIGSYWDGQKCVLCVELMSAIVDGDGSLECDMPGVTLETLPLAAGYWRGDVNRTIVQSCLLTEACKGGRGIISLNSTSTENYLEDDRYCETGYVGPYCAVCAKDFRRLLGNECLDCQGHWGTATRAVLWVAIALAPVLLISLMMYLLGGTRSFKQLRKKVCGRCCPPEPVGVTQWSLGGGGDITAGEGGEIEKRTSWKRMAKRLGALVLRAIPFQQIKIIIVVWQILTQCSDFADIPYPPAYKRFLGVLDAFNFDISRLLSTLCLMKAVNFYEKLVIVTLAPIIVLGILGLSYTAAMRWFQGSDRNAIESRQQAKARHASASLLVLFLVFSSVSTTIFSTFSCHAVEDLEVYLLRADYSLTCYDNLHVLYQVYAGVMILMYPIGIPLIFTFLLLKHRDKINPPTAAEVSRRGPRARTFPGRQGHVSNPGDLPDMDDSAWTTSLTSRSLYRGQNLMGPVVSRARVKVAPRDVTAGDDDSDGGGGGDRGGGGGNDGARTVDLEGVEKEEEKTTLGPAFATDAHCEEVLRQRAQDLDLQPTKFLWEPYEPRIFYYETVECGRRCLLTGALVFVVPNTAAQMAGACIFAFLSLLVFELIRPHLSQTDSWMYRIGGILIFFSNFLGLMVKADVSGEDAQSQKLFSVLLIGVHVIMFVAIFSQACLSIQLQLEESASDDDGDDRVHGPVMNEKPSKLHHRRGSIVSRVGDVGRNISAVARSSGRRVAPRSASSGTEKRAPTLASTFGSQQRNSSGAEKDDTELDH